MTGRATMLPAVMIVVIAFLTLIAISSGRSNIPDIVADTSYPHYLCVINDYCEGDTCTRENIPIVVYLTSQTGRPRLDFPRVNESAVMTDFAHGKMFETKGGEISGILTVFKDGAIDWTGTSRGAQREVEHFASGQCETEHVP